MKKQIKKLSLSKRTISNLDSAEMSRLVGGAVSYYGPGSKCHYCGGNSKNCTQNQNTCPGHNTCYTC